MMEYLCKNHFSPRIILLRPMRLKLEELFRRILFMTENVIQKVQERDTIRRWKRGKEISILCLMEFEIAILDVHTARIQNDSDVHLRKFEECMKCPEGIFESYEIWTIFTVEKMDTVRVFSCTMCQYCLHKTSYQVL